MEKKKRRPEYKYTCEKCGRETYTSNLCSLCKECLPIWRDIVKMVKNEVKKAERKKKDSYMKTHDFWWNEKKGGAE